MKQNKLKEKWNSLPWYTRDVVWHFAAAVGTLLLLIGMSECAHNNKKKAVQADKTTQLSQDKVATERYLQFKDAYIKQQQQKQNGGK